MNNIQELINLANKENAGISFLNFHLIFSGIKCVIERTEHLVKDHDYAVKRNYIRAGETQLVQTIDIYHWALAE